MQEIPFNLPISGTIKIGEDSITVTFNPAQIVLPIPKKRTRISLEKGQTVFDIVLRAAQRTVRSSGQNRFTAAELFHEALEGHPELKRNSWAAHVIASAPNHPSHNHFATKKDYFRYLGNGQYKLDKGYLTSDEDELEE